MDYWAEAWGLVDGQMRILHLYTDMHCVYFMGEMGQKFNKETPEPVGMERADYLVQVLDTLLGKIK